MSAKIKIVIADDHEVFREGLVLLLKKEKDLDIIGQVENGVELVNFVKDHTVDIVLTDIKMPKLNGVEAAKKIKQINPNIGIIALSMYNEETLVVDMLEAGAGGYLIKSADKIEILEAIDSVYSSRPYYCKSTNTRLALSIAGSKYNPFRTNDIESQLTPKEIQIMKLLCKEYSAKEIGESTFQSTRTVEGAIRRIQKRIGVKSSIGIVVFAIQKGIYKPSPIK